MRENDQEAIGYYEEVVSKARYTSQSILSSSYCNLGKLYFKTRLLPEALMNQLFCMAHSFLKYEKYFVRDLELLSSIYWLGGLDAEAKNVINEGYKLASRTNASLSETGESLYNLLVQNQNVDLEFSDEKIVTEDLFKDGVGFDGSSVRGFQSIENSDMAMVPDVTTDTLILFTLKKQLHFIAMLLIQ